MKRQLNLNILSSNDTLDLPLTKLIGKQKKISKKTKAPKLQSEDAIALSELSTTLDSLCEVLSQSEEDILLSPTTNAFIDKYAVESLTSIDQLLTRYSTSSLPTTQTKETTLFDLGDLLKDL